MQRTVLIVDDEADIVEMLALLLQDHGYTVLTACDGQHACEVLESARPDVILSDIRMPQLDGIAFCQRVKSNASTKHIPFVLMSANPPAVKPVDVSLMLQKPASIEKIVKALIESTSHLDFQGH